MSRLPKILPRRLILGLLLAFPSACRSAGGGKNAAPVLPADSPAPGTGWVSTNHQALLGALQAALAEGEDELAGHILANLRARALAPGELEVVESAERVLVGRGLVRGLELELASTPLSGGEGSYRLILVARSRASRDVCLRLPPCDLKRLRVSMDARGVEGLDYESKATAALGELWLTPTVERRIELLTYDLPLGRALGARERWRLETRSGVIEAGGELYPAGRVRVGGCERERLSPLLAAEPARAGELAERLEESEPPQAFRLLEIAMRTPSELREEALELLVPVVARLARGQPERIALAEPALRWLTQNRDLGPDALAWAHYLEARAAAAAVPSEGPTDGLDLPAPRRAPPAASEHAADHAGEER